MGVKAMVGGELVEALGKQLWKHTDIPVSAKKSFITTHPKNAGNQLEAFKIERSLEDQYRAAYENNDFEALTAGNGLINDVIQQSKKQEQVNNIVKPKSDATIKRENKKLAAAQADPIETTVSREAKAFGSNPKEARGQRAGQEPRYQSRQFAITEGDHGAGLDDNWPLLRLHKSFQDVEVGKPSILVQALNLLGPEIGDSPKNINDILNNLTKSSRRARVSALDDQLKGAVHRDTLNSRFSLSNFDPAELTGEQAVALNLFKKQNPGKTRLDFDAKWKEQTGQTLPQGSFGKDIEVFAPDGTTGNARTLLGKVPVKSEADKAALMSRIFDILEENKYPVEEARKAYDIKKIKVDRNLDIYGFDHDHKHILINKAKKKPNTAIGKMTETVERLKKGEDISNGEAFTVLIKSIQEQETILANQQLFRYEKIIELWHQDETFKHTHWDRQPAYVKQNFFAQYVNQIAVKGGLHQKLLNLEDALKPIDEWPKGAEEVFGWKPQTLDIPDSKIAETADKIDGVNNISDFLERGLGEKPYQPEFIR